MKKNFTIVALLIVFTANAQDAYAPANRIPIHFIHYPSVILLVYLATTFMLSVLKLILDHRLKYKMIEKGVSNDLVEQFFQTNNKDIQNEAIKGFILLAGIGVGLTISYFFTPFGIHTLAIMAFSIAISFFVYYNFLKRLRKQ